MAKYIDIKTIKEIGNLLPYSREKFSNFIHLHFTGIEDAFSKINMIVSEVELTIYEGITLKGLLESAILASVQNIQNDIDFEQVATRLAVTKIYTSALNIKENDTDFEQVYKNSFTYYINTAVEEKLLNPEMAKIFNLDELAATLTPDLDDIFRYIGIETLEGRYMVKTRDQAPMETPQYTWMRVAMGLSLKEKNPTEQAKIFYNKLSKIEYIPGGSTIIGSGTTYPVLSNCYLLDTEDDIHHIFDNIKNIALISKATGGIGISVTKLRASGSPVRSNNTFSTGPIPFIKVMDAALKSVSRAGKKAGAMAVYMENWHIDFPEFLDLKQNAGDDYRRIRTADTAVYISDEFMKRVINNEEWFMFDPLEVSELTELYGNEFSKKYNEYIEKAKRGEMKLYSVIPAKEQMQKILNTLLSTSHPWLTWKDTINLRALNNNTGTIHSSNLCTEVCLPQDRNNIAVCNLLYVNITNHVNIKNGKAEMDWTKLKDSVKTGMRHLDNLIDVNMPNVPQADHSDKANRAVGLGLMGLSEVLEFFGYSYDSEEAYNLTDKIVEFISYVTIDESANLAIERGSYSNFQGSMWSKGSVPYDTMQKVKESRKAFGTSKNETPLDNIKEKIAIGLNNPTVGQNSELNEIFKELNEYMRKIETSTQNSSETDLSESSNVFYEQNRNIKLDWEKLRDKVKKGMRNATTMMIAPNASTGLVAGTSPGVDPRFAQIFSRATSNGKFLDINHNLVKDLKKLGIWEQVREKVLSNYGDLTQIEGIPENIKNIYKTSFQISPYAFIEVASRAQKWIDQSISRNMYLDTRDIDEITEIYTEAWRRGLKTTYYLHTKPRHSAEQSTVKVNKAKALNKKGFGQIGESSVPTAQMSFEGKEVKGFGFAKRETQAEVAAMQYVEIPEHKKVVITDACPTDPMERALCEGCQ